MREEKRQSEQKLAKEAENLEKRLKEATSPFWSLYSPHKLKPSTEPWLEALSTIQVYKKYNESDKLNAVDELEDLKKKYNSKVFELDELQASVRLTQPRVLMFGRRRSVSPNRVS